MSTGALVVRPGKSTADDMIVLMLATVFVVIDALVMMRVGRALQREGTTLQAVLVAGFLVVVMWLPWPLPSLFASLAAAALVYWLQFRRRSRSENGIQSVKYVVGVFVIPALIALGLEVKLVRYVLALVGLAAAGMLSYASNELRKLRRTPPFSAKGPFGQPMRCEGKVEGPPIPFPLPLQPPAVAWWIMQGETNVKRPERMTLTCPSGSVTVDFANVAIDCSTSPSFNWEGISDAPRGRKLKPHEVQIVARAMPELGLEVDGATACNFLYLAHGDSMHSVGVVSGEPSETGRWDQLTPILERAADGSSAGQPELGFGTIASRQQVYRWRLAMAVGWGFVAAAVGCCQLLGHLRPAFS